MDGERLSGDGLDVSIVMPCLNESLSLPHCIGVAQEALAELNRRHGLSGEVVIADNGSTDGSQQLAQRLGARVVMVLERGYGAALRGGFAAARGRFLVMGDADGSYDFRDAVSMIERLMAGADLCMGSRFKGGIAPGAMPWKNRYIGNPVLTGVLNLLYGARIDDAHCGLRALTRDCFDRLQLTGAGMEFASEMVIKAALKRQTIAEVATTLSPDLRDRPPHLRPWRDGWRHLRYLFMLSPSGLFAAPAVTLGGLSLGVLVAAAASAVAGQPSYFGDYWLVLASAVLGLSHISAILAFASHLHGVRSGYRPPKSWVTALSRWVSLETMLISGASAAAMGFLILVSVALSWRAREFAPADSILPAVLGTLLMTLGAQNALGGFLLAIVSGNEARFLHSAPAATISMASAPPYERLDALAS